MLFSSVRDICFPIDIPPGDPHFRRSCLSFVRSIQVSNADCQSGKYDIIHSRTHIQTHTHTHTHTHTERERERERETFSGGKWFFHNGR